MLTFFSFFFVFLFKYALTSLSTHASCIWHRDSTVAAAEIEPVTTNSNQGEISLPFALDDSVSLLRSTLCSRSECGTVRRLRRPVLRIRPIVPHSIALFTYSVFARSLLKEELSGSSLVMLPQDFHVPLSWLGVFFLFRFYIVSFVIATLSVQTCRACLC